MAGQLSLKVSEEKVREAIGSLGKSIESMEGHLDQLIAQRQKLERVYKGPSANKAIAAIKEHENKARTSIEKTRKQKDMLQKYLDSMNTADSEIGNSYQEALNAAKNLFT